MRIHLAAAVVLGLLAGCSSDQDPSDSKTTAAADTARRAGAALPFVARSMTTSFASLPDRGELLAYQQGGQVKHSGAYTAYPVALSEAHALNAIRTGEMVVKAPDGELIRLQYERFVEHPDGNWSWIGRNADGTDAVLTFGEKAVFGTIPQGSGDSLRLTMSAGRSWLVSTNHAELPGPPRSDRPDHLVPPKLAVGASSDSGVGTASMRAESATAAAASSVIDVLIGYTNGLAQQLGGQSAANTRANNLIVITNQAYANSGINMRVRLVGAMQVTYPDNTDNGDALELLTGYTAGDGGGEIDPDPAFDALRAKRDELGADLVSLVRAFRTPENNGCGIAWLIGGGQTGIVQADAPFGYAVVSDGVDLDEGDGNDYFCREETLAHEMGHSMGQAHNKSDSDDTGVHAYSYGYREASSTGFYTVMAYPLTDSDQFAIRYFANPSVKVNGHPTGVANQSDNVRSMNITMPIVARFRATVIPIEGEQDLLSRSGHIADFNGDGKSDILWRNMATGANMIWRSGDKAASQPVASVTDLDWKIAGVGDFDGDGKSDILWRNTVTGANSIWKSGNKATWQSVASVTDVDWKVVGVDDFNGDGKSDILWRNTVTGANSTWGSGNKATWQSVARVADLDWLVVGTADFNGDGKSDVLWRNSSTGVNVAWRSADKADSQSVSRVKDTEWLVSGVGDYNGDNKADILWRNDTTGGNAIWSSANKNMYQPMASVANDNWIIAGANDGDFNGDGKSDVLWRNSVNGTNVIWMSADKTAAQILSSVADTNWSVMP